MVYAPNAGFVRNPKEGREPVTATSRPEVASHRAGAELIVETVRLDEHRAHVKASGDLDLSTGALLWAVLDAHVAVDRCFLRLDLSGVTFIDATALGGIARVHHETLARRGTLVLTGVRTRIATLLRLTGLDQVLFIGGPRADDDLEWVEPTRFPAQPVPWTPTADARRTQRGGPGRRPASRPSNG